MGILMPGPEQGEYVGNVRVRIQSDGKNSPLDIKNMRKSLRFQIILCSVVFALTVVFFVLTPAILYVFLVGASLFQLIRCIRLYRMILSPGGMEANYIFFTEGFLYRWPFGMLQFSYDVVVKVEETEKGLVLYMREAGCHFIPQECLEQEEAAAVPGFLKNRISNRYHPFAPGGIPGETKQVREVREAEEKYGIPEAKVRFTFKGSDMRGYHRALFRISKPLRIANQFFLPVIAALTTVMPFASWMLNTTRLDAVFPVFFAATVIMFLLPRIGFKYPARDEVPYEENQTVNIWFYRQGFLLKAGNISGYYELDQILTVYFDKEGIMICLKNKKNIFISVKSVLEPVMDHLKYVIGAYGKTVK